MQLLIKFRFNFFFNEILFHGKSQLITFSSVLCKLKIFHAGLSYTHQNVYYTECYEQNYPLSAAYVLSHGRLIWSLIWQFNILRIHPGHAVNGIFEFAVCTRVDFENPIVFEKNCLSRLNIGISPRIFKPEILI